MTATGQKEQEVQQLQQLQHFGSSTGWRWRWCCWWYHVLIHSSLITGMLQLNVVQEDVSSSSSSSSFMSESCFVQRRPRQQRRRRPIHIASCWLMSWMRRCKCSSSLSGLLGMLLLLLVAVIPRTAHADLPPPTTVPAAAAQQPEFVPSLQQQQQRTMRNLPISPSHKEPSRNSIYNNNNNQQQQQQQQQQRKVSALDEKEKVDTTLTTLQDGKPEQLPTTTATTTLEADEQQPSIAIPRKNTNSNGKQESSNNSKEDGTATARDDNNNDTEKNNSDTTTTAGGRNTASSRTTTVSPQQKQHEREFLVWCRQVLGIYTILEIETFEYDNFMIGLPETDSWDDNKNNGGGDDVVVVVSSADDDESSSTSIPKIHVRGLAASRDINIGETVIRIPLQALISVATTIDQDPVLSPVMGPAARKAHGWIISSDDAAAASASASSSASAQQQHDDNAVADDETAFLLEMPLLAMALLHHKRLKSASPLAHYVSMLEASPIDAMPFLWSREKLRAQVSEGIRTVARGIQLEMEEMYSTVVQVLIAEHPHLFGNNTSTTKNDDEQEETTTPEEWFFSYEHFQWAFAMVNSRHWHLPIPDLFATTTATSSSSAESATTKRATAETAPTESISASRSSNSNSFMESTEEQDAGGLPPASMPTDTWIQEHDGEIDEEEIERIKKAKANKPSSSSSNKSVRHSFLAPVADLLNFGPPCTKVHYNTESQTFEIIASCELKKGQEVTFYYSDECDHVMVGVYGFMHPLVPACPSAEDYRRKSEEYKRRAEKFEERLLQAYEDLDHAEEELRTLYEILSDCDCCHHEKPKQRAMSDDTSTPSAHVRGASRFFAPVETEPITDAPTSTHGVRSRRSWRERMSRKSEF